MSEYKLNQVIIQNSESKNWDNAKKEWKLDGVSLIEPSESMETCVCGHYPIRELCHIRNNITRKDLIVGNCCVNKFLEISTSKLFAAFKRVCKNITKPFNLSVIDEAYKQEYINDWEYDFYKSTWRKRQITAKMMNKRVQINHKILYKYDIEDIRSSIEHDKDYLAEWRNQK